MVLWYPIRKSVSVVGPPFWGTKSYGSPMGITEMRLRESNVRVSDGIAPLGLVGTLSDTSSKYGQRLTVPEGLCQRQEAEKIGPCL